MVQNGSSEAPEPYRPAKLDRAAVLALMDADVLADRRVELVEGELIEMSPAHNTHGAAVVAIPTRIPDAAVTLGEVLE